MYKITQFSERLKELMFERDLNAPALAKQTGIERSTINGLERGAHFPSIKVFVTLLDYFNCSADFLLGIIDNEPNEITFKPLQPFGEIFRSVLKKNQISQYKIEKDLHLSGDTVYKWLNNISQPNVESLVKISEYLDCSVDFLMGRE